MSAKNSGNTGNRLQGKYAALLCKALESAIPEEETLEQIMRFNLEDRLQNVPQAKTYPSLIFNLVEWAESNGKLQQLVIAASLENPANLLLQQFIIDNVQMILELSPLSLPKNNLLTSLLQELAQIRDFTGVVLSACSQTLPDFEISFPELEQQLFNNEIIFQVKWLILLVLFLITWKYNDKGVLYIVLFVRSLTLLTTGETKVMLTQWLNNLPESIRPASLAIEMKMYPERPSDKAFEKLHAYFLVTIEPLETVEPSFDSESDNYGVKVYIVTRLSNEERYTKIESISLSEPYYSFEEIEYNFPDWLIKAHNLIENCCIAIQDNYHLELPPVADLTVEFWLPFEHLIAATETWMIYEQPTRLKQLSLTLGKEYQVVIRSYDRFIDSSALNSLNRTWQNRANLPAESNTHHLECWTHWQALEQQLQDSCLSLSLTCSVCTQDFKLQREKLFAWMLKKGVPIILWSRSVELTDEQIAELKQKMQGMLTTDIISQSEQLLEQVKQARAGTNDLDKLALWFDEPKRLIELKKFREKGRLHV